jgi:hypothetical protein
MRTVTRPDDSPGDVFTLCISKVRRRHLKEQLVLIKPNLVQAAQDYDVAATAAALHAFPKSGDIGAVSGEEVIKVYTGRMVPETQPGRPIYDKLLNAVRRCPLCGEGIVKTLDHHLPKTEYTALSVTPVNLVPACLWCQDSKSTKFPETADEQTLHPYYDNFTDQTWLRAEVVQTRPASFSFSVQVPPAWAGNIENRLAAHMKTFDLYNLYSLKAGGELEIIHFQLDYLFTRGGREAVKVHLEEGAATRRAAQLNSWETAMYEAAAASDWFCDRGFDL